MALSVNDVFDDLRAERDQLKSTVEHQRQLIAALLEVKAKHETGDKTSLPALDTRINELLAIVNKDAEEVQVAEEATPTPRVKKARAPRPLLTCPEPDCPFRTRSRQTLDDHGNSHALRVPYECGQCGKRFGSRASAHNHRRYVHRERALRCAWLGCEFSTRFQHRLDVHQNVHLEIKPFACDWPGCDFSTAYRDKLKYHKHRHTGEKSFACEWPQCGQRFRERSHLTVHTLKHTQEKPWPCVTCEQRFQTKQSMRSHARRKHNVQQ